MHYVIGPQTTLCSPPGRPTQLPDVTSRGNTQGRPGSDRLKWFDRERARRYYRDIWLPYVAGPRISAENQLGQSLMPFADAAVSAAALRATPFVGSHGDFEAAMIRRLNRRPPGCRRPTAVGLGDVTAEATGRFGVTLLPLRARLMRHHMRHRRACRGAPRNVGGVFALSEPLSCFAA